jgi:hypothetical protein
MRPEASCPWKRMQGCQVLHRQLRYVACTIAPIVACQATAKVPTAIVDLNQRALAFKAVADAPVA